MSYHANRFFLVLSFLGIPYAIATTYLIQPMVIAGCLNVALALLAVATPTILRALSALASTPRR